LHNIVMAGFATGCRAGAEPVICREQDRNDDGGKIRIRTARQVDL
jgi:hypothetical protein